MAVLYVTGNGFDLHLRMETSYWHSVRIENAISRIVQP